MFDSFRSFGSAFGTLIFGYLLTKVGVDISLVIFAGIISIGVLLLMTLNPQTAVHSESHVGQLNRVFFNRANIRLSLPFFAFMFLQGLIIGYIPLKVSSGWGSLWVGRITSIFFIVPVLFSSFLGWWGDNIGRMRVLLFAYLLIGMGLIFLLVPNLAFIALGVGILAVAYSLMSPAATALAGDVSTDQTLESISALFWLMRMIGVLMALILSRILPNNMLIPVSMVVLLLSLLYYIPVLRIKTVEDES